MEQIVNNSNILSILCMSKGKWGMFLRFGNEDFADLYKAAPYLENPAFLQLLMAGSGYLMFDTEKEMNKFYNETVGEDGPTAMNPYDGNVKIYALTCNPEGKLLNENT